MLSHSRASLPRACRNAVLTSVAVVTGIAAGYGASTVAIDSGWLAQITPIESGGVPPPSGMRTERVQELVDRHDCWTNGEDMPADMIDRVPGHVVVTPPPRRNNPDPSATYSARLVEPALEHVFGDDPISGMVVHGFCR